ncbi:hypothetical protein [Pontibacter litorisediminis]|uniref:hypothetical protein n=1 Tax=Pontibacter litorisediminis TaxID=1846260 RepID=UPI0023EB6330|nr:hypothetical protein [Pontibacter litorisediminis]
MAKLSFLAFKTKWAALTGRFKDNSTFEIAEDDYREFSLDIAESVIEPVELLAQRVEKLENPAPVPKEGIKWAPAPKVSVEGNNVIVTPSAAEFNGIGYTYNGPAARENVVLPPNDFGTRIDILGATAANDGWVYIYGEEPGVTPRFQHPDQPDAELLFAAYLHWTSSGGGTVEQPAVVVKVVEIDGVDYEPDLNGRLVLPKQGSTVNSTDDIQTEGATNFWFTETRAIAAKATANLWSYIGLASSTATISLKGWLDFLTNKVKLNEEQIALRVKQVKQGTTTYTPDAAGLLILPDAGSAVPKGKTAQAGTTINFSQSDVQERTLSASVAITSISNPQQSCSIRLIIDSTVSNYDYILPAGQVTVLGGGSFAKGLKNIIFLDCYDAPNNKYFATITTPNA